jgi:hypothetical protein
MRCLFGMLMKTTGNGSVLEQLSSQYTNFVSHYHYETVTVQEAATIMTTTLNRLLLTPWPYQGRARVFVLSHGLSPLRKQNTVDSWFDTSMPAACAFTGEQPGFCILYSSRTADSKEFGN